MYWRPMTRGDEARIRELPKLIADEQDPVKVEILAAELENLLTPPRWRSDLCLHAAITLRTTESELKLGISAFVCA